MLISPGFVRFIGIALTLAAVIGRVIGYQEWYATLVHACVAFLTADVMELKRKQEAEE